jgi:hypothetical protein
MIYGKLGGTTTPPWAENDQLTMTKEMNWDLKIVNSFAFGEGKGPLYKD